MSLSFDPGELVYPAGHFIDGTTVPGSAQIAVHAPSDGRVLSRIPLADADMVDRAVQSARKAQIASGWGSQRPRERLKVLSAWADLIELEARPLAQLEAASSSRPVTDALKGDIAVVAEQIRFFAEFADKDCDALVPTADNQMGFISSEPYGVIGAITAWNVPLALAGWKLGPALAAGNAVVLKPSEMTPFSTLYLAELAVRAGVPEGIFNVVLGDGATTGHALVSHPSVGKVSFTGSTRAGIDVMTTAAQNGVKPVTLELGGKSPQVVFADADIELAAHCITRTILANAGQGCVAGSRVLVQRSVADQLSERIAALMACVVPGPTWDADTTYSPIISERQLDRIDSIVTAARQAGAEIQCGGARFDHVGSFYQPTLIRNVTEKSPLLLEEIFGPVLTVQSFADEDEATEMARHATYGLCAGLFTRDLSRAMRMVRKLEAGTVWVNRYGRSRDHILPTGGWKASGIGQDLGKEAYRANRRIKSVLIDL